MLHKTSQFYILWGLSWTGPVWWGWEGGAWGGGLSFTEIEPEIRWWEALFFSLNIHRFDFRTKNPTPYVLECFIKLLYFIYHTFPFNSWFSFLVFFSSERGSANANSAHSSFHPAAPAGQQQPPLLRARAQTLFFSVCTHSHDSDAQVNFSFLNSAASTT